jgi:uncharacterized protein
MMIEIKVLANSREELMEQISENQFRIKTRAVPEKGLANRRVLEMLSEYYKIPICRLEIVQGQTHSRKRVLIQGD